MIRALVTGANGFVGGAFCRYLVESGVKVRATVRDQRHEVRGGDSDFDICVTGDVGEFQGWRQVLSGVDMVIHAAARVHVMRERASNPLAEFRRVNAAGTEQLARQAAQCGVRRFVYVSSIAVNGRTTGCGRVFSENDDPQPQDPYGVSKLEAEVALAEVASTSALEVVIVRPPLVYGPNVRGNMATMLSWVYHGLPLPLAGIRNARSLIALENLCSFLHVCATHSAAAGQTFLISDEPAISTPQLLTFLAAGLARKARLYSVPRGFLEGALSLCGARNIYQRLCQSLVVDTRKAKERLGWRAPASTEQALEQTMRWYVESRHGRWLG